MTPFSPKLPYGVRRLFRLPKSRERMLREMDDEMRIHLDMRIDELRALGRSEAVAREEALRRFGDSDEFRAYAERRVTRMARWNGIKQSLTECGQEVRFAVRQFRKSPGFTLVALFTLAVGIGANTAIFSVVHRLLISPLPYPNGDRIVMLRVDGVRSPFIAGLASMQLDGPGNPSGTLVRAWRDRAHSFDAIAIAEPVFLALTADNQQDTLSHARVTPNYLPMLGVRPALGRSFTPADAQPGSAKVAMIGHAWWQRAYGGAPDVLGKLMQYEGESYTIIGVMPPGFNLPTTRSNVDQLASPPPDMWLTANLDEMTKYFGPQTFGLLREGVSPQDAERELQAIATSIRASDESDSLRVRAMRAQDFLDTRDARTVDVLFAAVSALLLIACANVANLLLARAWTRRREFAIRMGLGAGRARLTRQTLIESLLLAVAAGVLGLVLAWQGLRMIAALRPVSLPALANLRLEPALLFWTAAISVLTGLLFGMAPAAFARTRSLGDLLRAESRTGTGGLFSRRIRSTLIVLEIALSLVLLVSAGLLVRSFVALQRTELGFDPHNLVSVDILYPPRMPVGERSAMFDAIVERLRTVPGVRGAAFGMMPTAGYTGRDRLETMTDGTVRQVPVAQFTTMWISTNYPAASRIGLLEGRAPLSQAADAVFRPPFRRLSEEVVVNRALARRIAPDGHAVGARIRTSAVPGDGPMRRNEAWSTVVGVVDDVTLPGFTGDLRSYQMYSMPLAAMPTPTFVVRFNTVPPNVESVLRRAIHDVNPHIVTRRARVGDDYLHEALAPTRFAMALLGAFSIVALLLSAAGLYGVISYSVRQRTREIGIRVAMGAPPKAVTALVVRDGLRLAAVGLVVGVLGAIAATRALASMLYAVTPGDPLTFASIAVVVGAITLLASYIPARRAVNVDPTEALRAD